MLQGKLTYVSVAVLLLTWLGERFGVPIASTDAEAIILAFSGAAGVIGGIYGRWRATRGG